LENEVTGRGSSMMRRLGAWLCLIGGLSWSMKAAYDWLVLDRVVNRGYAASDFTDYAEFAIPLLCLAGLAAMRSRLGKMRRISTMMIAIGLILVTLYHVYETYFPSLGFAAGFMLLFPGTVLQWAGALFLSYGIVRQPLVLSGFKWWATALFVANSLFCLVPFLYGVLSDPIETPVTVTAVMLVGLAWASLGAYLLAARRHDEPAA